MVLVLMLTSTTSVIFEAPVATEVVVPWFWLTRVAKNDGFCMSAERPSLSWGFREAWRHYGAVKGEKDLVKQHGE